MKNISYTKLLRIIYIEHLEIKSWIIMIDNDRSPWLEVLNLIVNTYKLFICWKILSGKLESKALKQEKTEQNIIKA